MLKAGWPKNYQIKKYTFAYKISIDIIGKPNYTNNDVYYFILRNLGLENIAYNKYWPKFKPELQNNYC